jgi:hypothetical protein
MLEGSESGALETRDGVVHRTCSTTASAAALLLLAFGGPDRLEALDEQRWQVVHADDTMFRHASVAGRPAAQHPTLSTTLWIVLASHSSQAVGERVVSPSLA